MTDRIHYDATLQHQIGDGLTSELIAPRGPLRLSVLPADDSIVVGKTGVRVNLEAVPITVTAADASIVVVGSTIRVGVINDTQHGTRGGGGLHAPATGFTAGFMSPAHYNLVQSLGGTNPVPITRQIIAMDGIAGGGSLSGDVELAIIPADASIVAYEDSIAVGVISDAQHGARGGGDTHELATGSTAGFLAPAMYTLVDAATSIATPDTLVVRGGSGEVRANEFAGAPTATISGDVTIDFVVGGELVGQLDASHPLAVEPTAQEAAAVDDLDAICLFGTSLIAGDGASSDAATGVRLPLFQALRAAGARFTFVGPHGEGALRGAGVTHGRFTAANDYHAPLGLPPLGRWSHHGESGRLMSRVATVTAIDTATDRLTAAGHDLGTTSLAVLATTGTMPAGLSASRWYFASAPSGATFALAELEGGTAVNIEDAGSGTLVLGTGLAEMATVTLPLLGAQTVIVCAATNDISQSVDGADPDPLSTAQTRAIAMFDAIEAGAPGALRLVVSIPRFYSGSTNFAAKTAIVDGFNAWLSAHVPTRGSRWAYVDAAAGLSAAHTISDGVHLTRIGNRIYAEAIARGYLLATSGAPRLYPVPRFPRPRTAQPVLEMTATTNQVSIPDQAGIREGGANACWAIWWRPPATTLATGLNAIVQQNATTTGFLLAHNGANLVLYYLFGAPVIPVSSYTSHVVAGLWHRIFFLVDHVANQVGLYLNGRHVQTVNIPAGGISVQQALLLGAGGGQPAALGQYQGMLFAKGPDITIGSALELAEHDYYDGMDPPGVSARYNLSEGTGSSVAGAVAGSTAGTVTGATWLAANIEPRPMIDDGAGPLAGTVRVTGGLSQRTALGGGWKDCIRQLYFPLLGAPSVAQVGASNFAAPQWGVGSVGYVCWHIDHDYAPGTSVYFHVHWHADGTSTAAVTWEFTYYHARGHNQDNFAFGGAGTTITASQSQPGSAHRHMITETAAVSIPTLEPDSIIACRIRRVTNGGADNSDPIYAAVADVHYQTTDASTMRRSPPFYR